MSRQAGGGSGREPGARALESAVERAIARSLPAGHDDPELNRYYGLLREYPARVGKRIRARLTLQSTMAHGSPWQAGLTAAAAIELFQNWVLIHDDVEDDSDERRGKPTLHRQVGKPLAINAGDGLHAYMWQLLLGDPDLPAGVLAEFLWMIHRTSEGQHLDLAWVESGRFDVEEREYLEMVRLKTACYTVVSPLRLGALCAGRAPAELLTEAGENLGVAFQIRDDILNLTPGAPQGKEFAGDLFEGKRTLILAHFFAHADSFERQQAMDRLTGGRSGRSDDDVHILLDLLAAHGSIAYAQQVAEERAELGMSLVRTAMQETAVQESAMQEKPMQE
ncbi:MAG: polyprenyl synthetase family protein, partial [Trueperaceae bacterium]